MSDRVRSVEFRQGYNCIDFECIHGSKTCIPGSGGSHGRAGMSIVFLLKGPEGAVQFIMDINPAFPGADRFQAGYIMPTDLGYHSPVPQYDGQRPRECTVLGCPCYYDYVFFDGEYPKIVPYGAERRDL